MGCSKTTKRLNDLPTLTKGFFMNFWNSSSLSLNAVLLDGFAMASFRKMIDTCIIYADDWHLYYF